MAFPVNAIKGKPNTRRKQEKAKRLALESLQSTSRSLGGWVTTLSPEEMRAYVKENSTSATLEELAWMVGILRDVLLLKQDDKE